MDIQTFTKPVIKAIHLLQTNIHLTLIILGCLWLIHLLNFCIGYRLNALGIYPRKIRGLKGIVFAPLLHGSFNHLFFNSIPLFVLVDFTLLSGIHHFISITCIIMLFSGLGTWLFARRGMHVGASSVVMGYWGYLLIDAYRHPSLITIMLAILCIYYFGGLLFSIFPQEERVSWEGHLFGFLAGISTVYLFGL
jgi:membrane associated rhomboid family serine protease